MIILTNDDGVYSPGIMALAKSLAKVTDIKVVAPRGAQSSSGMSITFHRPLTMSKIKQRNYEATAITGTPADCVFVSIHRLFKKKKIEMIVSGINLGENVSMQSFSPKFIPETIISIFFFLNSLCILTKTQSAGVPVIAVAS